MSEETPEAGRARPMDAQTVDAFARVFGARVRGPQSAVLDLCAAWRAERARIDAALQAARDGVCEGAHHKQWVLDQVVRALAGEDYEAWVERFRDPNDQDGFSMWEEGTPP